MFSSIVALAIPIAVLFVVLVVRTYWLQWKMTDYHLRAFYYLAKVRSPYQVGLEMAATWPSRQILLDIFRWDFRRYVVYQHHFDDMNELIEKELERENLTMQEYAKLFADAMAEPVKPEQIDPSSN